MIITIAGVHNEWGGDDLSPYLDRTYGFSVNSILGQRLDTCSFTLMDNLPPILTIPDKAEIIIYDHRGVTDPTPDVPRTWVRGQAPIIDPPARPPFGNPTLWTPRLFGGYVGQAEYFLDGAQRYCNIHAQDYTIRLKQTVCNRAYGPDGAHSAGWLDSQMVRDISARYLPDIDTSLVRQSLAAALPAISFPTHSIEQFLERIRKITNAVYRIDYYKRFTYGPIGASLAPFAISDTPDNLTPVVPPPPNLLDANTSYAANDASDWSATNGSTPVRVTSPAAPFTLPSSMAWTSSAAGTSSILAALSSMACSAPGSMAASAQVRAPASRTLSVDLLWYDANGTLLSTTVGGTSPSVAASWVAVSVTGAVPATAQSFGVRVKVAGAAAAGEQFYATAVTGVGGTIPLPQAQTALVGAFPNLLTTLESSFEVPADVVGGPGGNPGASVSGYNPSTLSSQILIDRTSCQTTYGFAAFDGAGVMAINNSGGTNAGDCIGIRLISIVGGSLLTLSAYHRLTTGPAADIGSVSVRWFDGEGNLLSSVGVGSQLPVVGSWLQLSGAFRAPLNARFATVAYQWRTTDTVSRVAVIDAVQLVRGISTTYQNPSDPPPLASPTPPVQSPSYPCEELRYAPDWTTLYNRVWIVGSVFKGAKQTYQMFPLPDGKAYAFQLPAPISPTDPVSVTVGGVDQGVVGTLGSNQGTLDNQAGFLRNALVGYGGGGGGKGVPLLALKVTPPANTVITITGTFMYPLIQIVADAALFAAMGNVPFEKVVKDKRIDSVALATTIGNANIKAEGYTKRGGSCVVRSRGFGSFLLQPGQYILVKNTALLTGLFTGAQQAFVIVGVNLTLENDVAQPYRVAVTFSDRQDASDDDVWNLLAGEQARLNAALEQSDIATLVSDTQLLADAMAVAPETVVASNVGISPYKYDGGAGGFNWGFGKWS